MNAGPRTGLLRAAIPGYPANGTRIARDRSRHDECARSRNGPAKQAKLTNVSRGQRPTEGERDGVQETTAFFGDGARCCGRRPYGGSGRSDARPAVVAAGDG